MCQRFGFLSISPAIVALATLIACTSDDGDAVGAGGAGGSTGGDAGAREDAGASHSGSAIDALISAMEEADNVVQRAGAEPFFVEDCEALPSCFASNASSPYALWNLPPAPGMTGADPGAGIPLPPRTPEGTSPGWRLRPDEAVLYIGRTPPKARYFSYAPYIFDRENPDTGERVQLFASLSDALNQVNLATAEGGPFEAETILIVTAHAGMEQRARQWLEDAGYDPAIVNTVVIPSDQAILGLESEADNLMLLQRFALFDDEAAGRAYLEDLPVEILRVTPNEPLDPDPLPTPERTPRGSGTTEDALLPALDALEAAILERHGAPSDEPLTIASAELITSIFDPLVCMRDFTECKGEVSDTTYSAGPIEVTNGGASLRLTADPDDYFIAFGVNHEATGKATYSNVVVTNWNKQAGVASLDSPDMAGSAAEYLPDHPDADQLFVVKVARACEGARFCIEVPTTFPGLPLDHDVIFLFRAYLEPGRSVSPGPAEILPERVLHYVP